MLYFSVTLAGQNKSVQRNVSAIQSMLSPSMLSGYTLYSSSSQYLNSLKGQKKKCSKALCKCSILTQNTKDSYISLHHLLLSAGSHAAGVVPHVTWTVPSELISCVR